MKLLVEINHLVTRVHSVLNELNKQYFNEFLLLGETSFPLTKSFSVVMDGEMVSIVGMENEDNSIHRGIALLEELSTLTGESLVEKIYLVLKPQLEFCKENAEQEKIDLENRLKAIEEELK